MKMNKNELLMTSMFEDLPYRKRLGIEEPFGVEIEMGLINPKDESHIYNDELKKLSYYTQDDNSIEYYKPLEIVSPILLEKNNIWPILYRLSERMKECELEFDTSAFQVNFDINYSDDELDHMLLFFQTYEHIIFRFSKAFDDRLRNLKYAASLREFIYMKRDLNNLINSKSYALAFKKRGNLEKGIVEFRTPNSCDDAWVWQNIINTFYHFKVAIKDLDLDYVDFSYHLRERKPKSYITLDIDRAIEFADIIFDKEIDKLYFMKQYIGNDIVEAVEKEKVKSF